MQGDCAQTVDYGVFSGPDPKIHRNLLIIINK